VRLSLLTAMLVTACSPAKVDGIGGIDSGGDGGSGTDGGSTSDGGSGSDGGSDDGGSGDTGEEPQLPDYDILVDCEGSAEYTTIQDAINGATSGDRIALMPCDYHERIDYIGKWLDIYGLEGPEVTRIDGDDAGTVVNVESAEGAGTRLAGVTIRDGLDIDGGSAIEVTLSALKLENVIIEENNDSLYVAYLINALVDMEDVIIRSNGIIATGAAIYTDGGILTATRLEADCDKGDYAMWQHNATLLLDTTLTCDAGYGLYSYHGELQIKRGDIYGGIAGVRAYDEEDTPSEQAIIYNSRVGGGSVGIHLDYMTVSIANNVVWGGDAAIELLANSTSSWIIANVLTESACGIESDVNHTASYNAFWANGSDTCGLTATNSVTADPEFASFPDDLSISSSSPLIDAGYPGVDWYDPDGTRNDIGLTGGPWAD
jgi:hypothetical protein